MYKEFFGLKENPFDLTPDSHFLFPSKKHQEALAHLAYGIEARKGFILITGEVGAGKTTLCRALLSRMDANTEVAFVLNSYLNAFEILQTINQDLGIKTKAQSKKELIDELNEFLLSQKHKNKNVVVLIDECQNLPFETLEQLRMLSNLETEKEKLLQIIMVGQPELLDILKTPEIRQLNQRITVRYHLYPLDYHETVDYIYHRLKVAGSEGGILFTDKALKKIYAKSKGIPRIINVICDNSLLAAYVVETKKITLPMVKKAIREIEGKKPLKDIGNKFFSWGFSLKRVFKYAFAGTLILMFAGLAFFYDDFNSSIGSYTETLANARKLFQDAFDRIEKQRIENENRPVQLVVSEQGKVNIAPAVEKKFINPSIKPVVSLLKLWGVDGSLIETIEKTYGGADKLDFEKIALESGLSSVESWADLNTLIKFNLPVLLQVSDPEHIRKYMLLKSITDGEAVVVGDGASEKMKLTDLEKIFVGNALIFVRGVVNTDEIFYRTNTGKIVEQIQQMLKELGYYAGDIDGVYNDAISSAVRNFQKNKGLNPDGIVDINTRLALLGNVKNDRVPHLNLN